MVWGVESTKEFPFVVPEFILDFPVPLVGFEMRAPAGKPVLMEIPAFKGSDGRAKAMAESKKVGKERFLSMGWRN